MRNRIVRPEGYIYVTKKMQAICKRPLPTMVMDHHMNQNNIVFKNCTGHITVDHFYSSKPFSHYPNWNYFIKAEDWEAYLAIRKKDHGKEL